MSSFAMSLVSFPSAVASIVERVVVAGARERRCGDALHARRVDFICSRSTAFAASSATSGVIARRRRRRRRLGDGGSTSVRAVGVDFADAELVEDAEEVRAAPPPTSDEQDRSTTSHGPCARGSSDVT